VPLVWTGAFPIGDEELEVLWAPYLRRLGEALLDVRVVSPGFQAGIQRIGPFEAVRRARRVRGRRARSWL
jgi:hypothetical protein